MLIEDEKAVNFSGTTSSSANSNSQASEGRKRNKVIDDSNHSRVLYDDPDGREARNKMLNKLSANNK